MWMVDGYGRVLCVCQSIITNPRASGVEQLAAAASASATETRAAV